MVLRASLLRAGVSAIALAAAGATLLKANSDRERTLALHNIHTKETVSVVYKRNGKYQPEAMKKLEWVLRDWRKNETTEMDPALIDLMWEVHTELGSKEPIHIISGFRSRGTNDMLRKTVGGQASESRHILGKAADVHFPDVPIKKIRYSALIREKGGVGYYPTSATPFVHLDTDRVRHWPRLPRYELALLFPSGRTQHQPADGGPITREDVQVAQSRHRDLAVQVAEFHDQRQRPAATVAVADASGARTPAQPARATGAQVAALAPAPAAPAPQRIAAALPPPRLLAEPALVDRPTRLSPPPSADDRNRLTQLFALASMPSLVAGPAPAPRRPQEPTLPSLTGKGAATPPAAAPSAPAPRVAAIDPAAAGGALSDAAGRLGFSNGWAPAPAFDEEHPEELSYRPFPIAPYMTATASADDPALAVMTLPDVARTLELLDGAGAIPPMKLRPGQQVAQVLWAQQFQGPAIAPNLQAAAPAAATDIQRRPVKTTANR